VTSYPKVRPAASGGHAMGASDADEQGKAVGRSYLPGPGAELGRVASGWGKRC
jgi:hypothetical protein